MYNNLKALLEKNTAAIVLHQLELDKLAKDFMNFPNQRDENLLSVKDRYISLSKEINSLLQTRIHIFQADKALTWKDVLDLKLSAGYIGNAQRNAQSVGYAYYVWNGCIYYIGLNEPIALVDDLILKESYNEQ